MCYYAVPKTSLVGLLTSFGIESCCKKSLANCNIRSEHLSLGHSPHHPSNCPNECADQATGQYMSSHLALTLYLRDSSIQLLRHVSDDGVYTVSSIKINRPSSTIFVLVKRHEENLFNGNAATGEGRPATGYDPTITVEIYAAFGASK